MSKERAPAMPWYGREFYADENVQVLTLEQEAAYLRLLWNCWQEGSIPADTAKLAAMCKNTPVRRFERYVWPALRNLFSVCSLKSASMPSIDVHGRLFHRKVDILRDVKEAYRAKCSESGKLGNQKRWGNDRVPDTDPITSRSLPDENPNRVLSLSDFRLPISDLKPKTCASGDALQGDSLPPVDDPPFGTTEPENKPKKRAKPNRELTPQQESWFTSWWDAYWLRKARKPARDAFCRHVQTEARFQQVMAATRAQAPEMLSREPAHRPHGATWLNAERWEDETSAEATPKRTKQEELMDRI